MAGIFVGCHIKYFDTKISIKVKIKHYFLKKRETGDLT